MISRLSYLSKKLFKKKDRKSNFEFTKDKSKYKNYNIGVGTYGSPIIKDWGDGGKLYIGKYCSIANNVTILLGGQHKVHSISTYPFFSINSLLNNENNKCRVIDRSTKGDVRIGNDVWLGEGVTILSGVSIGDGAIIGAKCVVAKNIPPYAIAVGNPFKILKYRFTEAQISALLEIKWWDWDSSKIKLFENDLMLNQIDEFIRQHLPNKIF